MSWQTAAQLLAATGIAFTALGTYGAYHFGQINDAKKEAGHQANEQRLTSQIEALQKSNDQILGKIQFIYETVKPKSETWTKIEMKNVPPGVTDYLLVLFRSDKGRISGNVRIEGSDAVSAFSTTANNTHPVTVRNVWLPKEGHYKMPTIMEFLITEKSEPDATLSIFTAGWLDSLGAEPH